MKRSNDATIIDASVREGECEIKIEFPPLHPLRHPAWFASSSTLPSVATTHTFNPMARRSAAPNSGPAYYSRAAVTGRQGIQDLDDVETSPISRFMNEEIWAPEKLPGNIAIVTSISVFAAGIFFVRNFGELIIP